MAIFQVEPLTLSLRVEVDVAAVLLDAELLRIHVQQLDHVGNQVRQGLVHLTEMVYAVEMTVFCDSFKELLTLIFSVFSLILSFWFCSSCWILITSDRIIFTLLRKKEFLYFREVRKVSFQ